MELLNSYAEGGPKNLKACFIESTNASRRPQTQELGAFTFLLSALGPSSPPSAHWAFLWMGLASTFCVVNTLSTLYHTLTLQPETCALVAVKADRDNGPNNCRGPGSS